MDDAVTETMPLWAHSMVDLHVHAAPSLLPRHEDDRGAVAAERALGFSEIVLKSHEGSTVERAAALGAGVHGGIVLNSPVGGANPDAVEVAARLGGRIVWMPTTSSANHQASAEDPELAMHKAFEFSIVPVFDDLGHLHNAWLEVFDVIAEHDMVLASGHLAADETAEAFEVATTRGVGRLLVNHPKMPFLGWNDAAAARLREVGAHMELGILPDLADTRASCLALLEEYPHELLVFGGDLGHVDFPTPAAAVPAWVRSLASRAGEDVARAILGDNGRRLLLP